MTENRILRVGLIGAGLQGGRRAPVLKQFPRTELVMVAAAHPEQARQLADSMGCQATDNWQEVVEREDINVIVVCTPPNLHAPISIAAMSRGKHVLCEKPMCLKVEDADKMIDAAKKNGKKLFVVALRAEDAK